MEHLTLGELAYAIGFIATLLTSGGVIVKFALKNVGKIVQKELEPIKAALDANTQQIRQVDVDNTKNYLQQTISAVNDGATLDNAARERFYENYDHYTNDLHLNSWVHKEVEKLEKEGKL